MLDSVCLSNINKKSIKSIFKSVKGIILKKHPIPQKK